MNALRANRWRFLAWLCALLVIALSACSAETVRGRVVGVLENRVTVRKENDRLVTVSVENGEEIRVLDTIVVKNKRAEVKDRVLGSD